MKFLLFFVMFSSAYARTTYEQILNNNSLINKNFAKKLAYSIDFYADKYKVPANALAAIAMVESSYNMKAVNKKSNDYGLFQINRFNMRAYGFDKERMFNNLNYAVESGAIVFKWFYKTYGSLEEAIKRYNCGTKKSCVNWSGPVSYWKKFKKYY